MEANSSNAAAIRQKLKHGQRTMGKIWCSNTDQVAFIPTVQVRSPPAALSKILRREYVVRTCC